MGDLVGAGVEGTEVIVGMADVVGTGVVVGSLVVVGTGVFKRDGAVVFIVSGAGGDFDELHPARSTRAITNKAQIIRDLIWGLRIS